MKRIIQTTDKKQFIPLEVDAKRKRSSYTLAKKREVIRAYQEGDHTAEEVCQIHGIKHPSLLYRWLKEQRLGKLRATAPHKRKNVKGTVNYKSNGGVRKTKHTNNVAKPSFEPDPDGTMLDGEHTVRDRGEIPITPFNLPNGTQLISRVNGNEPDFDDRHSHITLEAIMLPIKGDVLTVTRAMANEIAELFEAPNVINNLTRRSK